MKKCKLRFDSPFKLICDRPARMVKGKYIAHALATDSP